MKRGDELSFVVLSKRSLRRLEAKKKRVSEKTRNKLLNTINIIPNYLSHFDQNFKRNAKIGDLK
jgi:hypothetical protein